MYYYRTLNYLAKHEHKSRVRQFAFGPHTAQNQKGVAAPSGLTWCKLWEGYNYRVKNLVR